MIIIILLSGFLPSIEDCPLIQKLSLVCTFFISDLNDFLQRFFSWKSEELRFFFRCSFILNKFFISCEMTCIDHYLKVKTFAGVIVRLLSVESYWVTCDPVKFFNCLAFCIIYESVDFSDILVLTQIFC